MGLGIALQPQQTYQKKRVGNLESDSHFRPYESVPPFLLPQFNANGFGSELVDSMELEARNRHMRETKMWWLVFMAKDKQYRKTKKKFFPFLYASMEVLTALDLNCFLYLLSFLFLSPLC